MKEQAKEREAERKKNMKRLQNARDYLNKNNYTQEKRSEKLIVKRWKRKEHIKMVF